MSTRQVQDCGCGDFRTSRRSMLGGAVALGGAAVVTRLMGEAFLQASYASVTGNNVLVVLSMRGGADGLSLVVPHGDPAYAVARPKTAVPTDPLLFKDPMFGLHPSFAPLTGLWNAGQVAVVHAAGLPAPNRSHFSAMEELEEANVGSTARQGWLNRLVGGIGTSDALEGMQLGTPLVPTSMWGSAPTLATDELASLMLPGHTDAATQDTVKNVLAKAWAGETGKLVAGATSALSTSSRTRGIALDTSGPQNGAAYPLGDLGKSLAEAARLIRADLGVQVVAVDYGSWDMHIGMGNVSVGAMQSQVDELARALAAFYTDLGTTGTRVTLVTLTEFGRRVAENGAGGTDHGYGSAMFLLGAGVSGGYHGRWPGLGTTKLVDGDLAVTTDYRDVLAEVVTSRFPATSVPGVLPGFVPTAVGAMT
jgi:uncharacterized protein (DUF1501 family)